MRKDLPRYLTAKCVVHAIRKVRLLIKVLWSNQEYEEATWEAEDEMRKKYPELF